MIDVHSHVLPGLDDGAENMTESLKIMKMAERQGITDVIATPHYSWYFRNDDPGLILDLCRQTENQAKAKISKEIRIRPGQEIMYSEDAFQKLLEGKLLTLADSKYVLIEFMPSMPYSFIQHAVLNLSECGYYPIIAHAERYQTLNELSKIDRLKHAGAWIQLNFRPLGGRWYDRSTRWCRRILRAGLADFLGTDTHNTDMRKPETGSAIDWMNRNLDPAYVTEILESNPLRIITKENL